MKLIFTYIFLIFFLFSCEKSSDNIKPNVILIMADDIGYECIGVNGSNSYSTPILDSIASKGIRFTNAFSQPLCTPSRLKIMTGRPNYENYEYFGYLGSDKRTFETYLKKLLKEN